MIFTDEVYNGIKEHAECTFPKECCGVVLNTGRIVRMHNCAASPKTEFKIHPMDYLRYEKATYAIYHSHCNRSPEPSEADRRSCEATGKPYLIMSVPEYKVSRLLPSYLKPPLLERPFIYGVSDCYALVTDYFKQVRDTALPEFVRPPFGWWDNGEIDTISEHYAGAGFTPVETDPEPHDVILMANNNFRVPSHLAVYVGEMNMMHHPVGSLSRFSSYGSVWKRKTVGVLRYVG